MNLCVDCFNLVKGKGKSIGIYNLAITTIKNIKDNLSTNDKLFVFGNEYNKTDFSIDGVEFILINKNPFSLKTILFWENFVINKFVKTYFIDAILLPRGYTPIKKRKKCNYVVTINDMIPFFYHKTIKRDFSLSGCYIRLKLKYSARHANRIITISDFSKNDIVKYSKIDEKKISVVYCSLNEVAYQDEDNKGNYIVAVTSKLPHKNAIGVLKAYDKYHSISKNPLPIHIIGIDNADNYYKLSESTKKDVICKGFLKSNFDHYSEIHNGKVFLFMSMSEGFGFPPIEAMQCGVPVVSSNAGSLNEVVGKAGKLVDYNDYDKAAEFMNDIVSNDDECKKYIKLGFENVERFENINQGLEYYKILTKREK